MEKKIILIMILLAIFSIFIGCSYANGNLESNVTDESNFDNESLSIKANDLVKIYKNDSQFESKFYDNDGNILTNYNVSFTINGVSYNRTTDNNGVGKMNINLQPGEYEIISYNFITNENKINQISILSSIEAHDLVKYYKNDSKYCVNFFNSDGTCLSNQDVFFNINGVFYTKKTNSLGIASLNINLNVGNYIITATNPVNNQCYSNNISILSTINGSNLVKYYRNDSQYFVSFINSDGSPLSNINITFNINGVFYYSLTNLKGIAKLNINLNPGMYIVTVMNPVNNQYYSNNISVLSILETIDINKIYDGNTIFEVKLLDNYGESLENVSIIFNIGGKLYENKTNDNGLAILETNLDVGEYIITSSYNGLYQSNNIKISPKLINICANDLFTNPNQGDYFNINLTDGDGNILSNFSTIISINGVDYHRISDLNGIVSLKINLDVGYYEISYRSNNLNYEGEGNNHVLVNGTIFESFYTYADETNHNFKLKLLNAFREPIYNVLIHLNFNSNDYYLLTDENGLVNLDLDVLDDGVYEITFDHIEDSGRVNKGSQIIQFGSYVSLNAIIKAAVNLRYYIGDNYQLPNSIMVSGNSYSIATFMYLMANAVININNGIFDDIKVKFVKEPDVLIDTGSYGNLASYSILAENIINYADYYGNIPEIVQSNVGDLGFKNLIYEFSRILTYKDYYGYMPSFRAVKSIDITEVRYLNSENTIDDLSKYLSATSNCAVNSEEIQNLANCLTEGLTTDLDKAIAIFNYCRDNIAYDYYQNSHQGSLTTLHYESGNCCDQAHLSIALYRAAGLPARYVHGSCQFNSGFYGHVWAQVLIGDTWVVSDTIGDICSLGVVDNWNNYNYNFHSYYATLPF